RLGHWLTRPGNRIHRPWPGGRRLGRRGRQRGMVVEVEGQVGLDRSPELVAGPPGFPHPAPESPAQLREPVPPEPHEGQGHDDEELLDADVEHATASRESYTSEGGRASSFCSLSAAATAARRSSARRARATRMRMASRYMWLPDHMTPPPKA